MNVSTARSFLVIATLVVAAGCHAYRPAAYQDLTPGVEVRARITGAYADSLDQILLRDARTFEGTIVEGRGPSVLVEIPVRNDLRGITFNTISQRVEIPQNAFVDLELKEFDRKRTMGAMALAGGLLGAAVVAQLNARSGGATSPGGGGPVEARVPLALLRAILR